MNPHLTSWIFICVYTCPIAIVLSSLILTPSRTFSTLYLLAIPTTPLPILSSLLPFTTLCNAFSRFLLFSALRSILPMTLKTQTQSHATPLFLVENTAGSLCRRAQVICGPSLSWIHGPYVNHRTLLMVYLVCFWILCSTAGGISAFSNRRQQHNTFKALQFKSLGGSI